MKPSVLKGFAMGDEACDGLRIGLKTRTTRIKVGGGFRYQLAIAHRGSAPRRLVLFSDMEPIYRARLRVEAAGHEPAEIGLVVPQARTLSGASIAIDLNPDDVSFSEGSVTLPARFKGDVEVRPVLGGTDAMPCNVVGKPIRVFVG